MFSVFFVFWSIAIEYTNDALGGWTQEECDAEEAHYKAIHESELEHARQERASIDSVDEIPGEVRIKTYTGRWDYVEVKYGDGHTDRRYYHVDCDCITTDDGCCLLCGKQSPGYAG